MIDLEQIHAVEAGIQSLIAFIVGAGMQHLIVHQRLIVAMQDLSHQEKVLLQPVAEAAEPAHKVMIQQIGNIQTQTVDIEVLHPETDAFQNVIHNLFIFQIQLHQVIISLPALIPQAVIIVGIAAQIDMEPVQIRRILPVLQHVLEGPEASSHMVEHPVQNHADSRLMQTVAHLCKIPVASQPAVNFSEISCIITVSIGFKHRRKVNRVRADPLYMRNPLLHLQNPGLFHTVIFKRRSTEAQRIDLIKYALICPHF